MTPTVKTACKAGKTLFLSAVILALSFPARAGDKPKLILQITVDQFRGDLPTRYYDRLGEGGLKYLLDEGLVYNNAHHAQANTETIVGHATLATGAHPSEHVMIGNIWFDREKGSTTYNIEDPRYHLLTAGADVDAATEIDPTQKAASSDGRSPADDEDGSVFDTIWSHATLYENEENRHIQKFVLSGRLQTDSAWVDADQGDFHDGFLWRRFRFGFKSYLFNDWVLHIEGDFKLAEADFDFSHSDFYNRLTDAYFGWTPGDNLTFKVLKQSAGFTLDGATSSKKLLTMQRNNLTNNLWFTKEYFTGISVKGEAGESWSYKAGLFSADGGDELGSFNFNAGHFTLLSLDHRINDIPVLGSGQIRVDYVYNNEDTGSATQDFSQVLSLSTEWEAGAWGLRTDLAAGDGHAGQSDIWGLVLMPYYNFNSRIQGILRYTYINSEDANGIQLPRYHDRVVDGRGDEYNEFYAGLTVFFYGQKFMWQMGLEHASMKDFARDGDKYDGWGVSTGLRLYW